MKTLYININNKQIQSNEELEVLKHDLDSDFFFYLGEKIAKGCKVENENALISDFNTKDNEEDYKQIITQWNELKGILFSEEWGGKFEFTLPNGYIHWLKFHPQYVSVYDRNFSHGEPTIITIDLEELYKDSVEDLQRKILRKLQRDDLYLELDKIVFNDNAITRKSPIIRAITNMYNGISFIDNTKIHPLSVKQQLSQNYKENPELYENSRDIISKSNENSKYENFINYIDSFNVRDNKGNLPSKYLKVSGLVLGASTKADVVNAGGGPETDLPDVYLMPNELEVFFVGGNVVQMIKFDDDKQLPRFYKKNGIKVYNTRQEVYYILETLGFEIEEDSEMVISGELEINYMEYINIYITFYFYGSSISNSISISYYE